jgi:hypothetical protein
MRANIPIDGLCGQELLEDWAWLLKKPHTIAAMNNFGDMFLSDEQGQMHFLDITFGELSKVASLQGRTATTDGRKGESAPMVPHGPSHPIGTDRVGAILWSMLRRQEATDFGWQMGTLKHRYWTKRSAGFADGADSSAGQEIAAGNEIKDVTIG